MKDFFNEPAALNVKSSRSLSAKYYLIFLMTANEKKITIYIDASNHNLRQSKFTENGVKDI